MKKHFFTLSFSLFLTAISFAQVVSGSVKDEDGEAFRGATIRLKGSTKVITANADGSFKYTLNKPTDTLIVSIPGFGERSIAAIDFLKEKNPLSIVMRETHSAPVLSEKIMMYESMKMDKAAFADDRVVSMGAAKIVAPKAYAMDMRASKSKKPMPIGNIVTKTNGSFIMKQDALRQQINLAVPKAEANFFKELNANDKKDLLKKTADEAKSEDEPEAGKLTAGEWNDLKNWDFWKKSLDKEFKQYVSDWQYNFTEKYDIILRGSDDQPVADAVILLKNKKRETVWTTRTNNLGQAVLFEKSFNKTQEGDYLAVLLEGKEIAFDDIKLTKSIINELRIQRKCYNPANVDIAFVVDATGSMGDEISFLKSELYDVIRRVKRDNQQATFRLGSVFYRDFGDEYVSRVFDFSKSVKQNVAFIKEQNSGGGGDFEEAVPEGLEAAIDSMSWNETAVARLLFLILDAPPHLNPRNIEKMQRIIQKATAKGIRIIPVTASGIDKNTEYLMKSLAVATGGTYTFLTDDSGVGNAHIKATTEKHEIEKLNDLLYRLIQQSSTYKACEDLQAMAKIGGDAAFGLNFKNYPNPARDVMTIEMNTDVNDVYITDITGRLVKKIIGNTEGVHQVEVGDMPNGVYFLNFKKDELLCSKKFNVIN
jgi:Secretion system C-terminal sorting domain/von Willebrand factor type A domain